MKDIKTLINKLQTGDTIVEVLLAIAIASFAIGISYATAQRSLQQSVTAREHNEALNELENQVADLKLRYQQSTPANFNANFTLPKTHFCLDDSANDPNNAATWNPYMNDGPGAPPAEGQHLATKTDTPTAGPYDPKCTHQKSGDGVVYYVDIVTSNSSATSSPTLYQIIVRWERLGGGQTNQASLNYRLNGGTTSTLGICTGSGCNSSGGPVGGGGPPLTTSLTINMAVTQDTDFTPTGKYGPPPDDPPRLMGFANGTLFLDCRFPPTGPPISALGNCAGIASPYTCGGVVPGTTSFTNPASGTGTWDKNEVCNSYGGVTGLIPVAASNLQTLDFEFVNDRWYFTPPLDAFDDNIMIYGASIPGHQINFANYCQVTPLPVLPPAGQPLSPDNVLPLYWGAVTAHLVIDTNSPDAGSCTFAPNTF